MPPKEEHDDQARAARLQRLLRTKDCCFRHLRLLLEESAGLPFSALTHVNFLYCFDCREKVQHNSTEIESCSSSPSTFLHTYVYEFSAAVARKASRRSLTELDSPVGSSKQTSLAGQLNLHVQESVDEADVEDDGALMTVASSATKASTIESIPHHLLFGDAVLSHLPLCDIARARFVSRAWMTHIDRALQDPAAHMHPCLRYPCLMLLNPGSAKTGACAGLSVYDVRLNSWLPKPILFPCNASFLVGASLGLFCFATGHPYINRNVDLYVGNPLLHVWTCLPRAPALTSFMPWLTNITFVASQGSPNGLSYKLLAFFRAGDSQDYKPSVFMYDSDKREWDKLHGKVILPHDMVEHILLEDPLGLLYLFDASMSRFCLYNFYMNEVQERHYVEGMRSYVFAKNLHAMQAKKDCLGLPVVVKCAERLFRVCRMKYSFPYEPYAVVGLIPLICQCWPIKLFRLADKTRWEMVSEMPPGLLREAVEGGSDGTDFIIGSDRTQHLFFILRGSSKMLAYDVLSSEWKTLPGCFGGCSFYPYRLHAFYEPLMCYAEPSNMT